MPVPGVDSELHLGAFVTVDYELRITERCLTRDLGLVADTSFERALDRPIVTAFRAKRAANPGDGETVGPRAGDRTLYKLRGGGRHRGATLFDSVERVVWLCASGFHTSGEPDDAYRLFAVLIESKAIEPTSDDYRRLGRERARRYRDLVRPHSDALIRLAADRPGLAVAGLIGRELPARLTASIDGDLLDLAVAFPTMFDKPRLHLALAALAADPEPAWEVIGELAGAPLTDEVGFRLYGNPLPR
ncbi:MAG TPA: hypothetical protein VIK08_02795 [Candidatus Limnocylindrales bacterium]